MFQFIRTDDGTSGSKHDSSHVADAIAPDGVALDAVAPDAIAPDAAAPDVAASSVVAPVKSGLDVSKLDRAGATASFLCAIHCAVMPFVVALLPLLGLSFLASESVEWALLAASASLGSWSLCQGFRQHRSRRVFMVLGVALALLLAGRLFHEHHFGIWGPILMVLGGLTMMSAHLLNHRLCHACKKCSADGSH